MRTVLIVLGSIVGVLVLMGLIILIKDMAYYRREKK